MDNDRTELNDLSEKFPQRVTKMANKWFDIARNKERLNQKGLGPVKEEVKQISFRRDTSDQLED